MKHIKKGSIIYSDSWSGYGDLGTLGYIHEQVNHSETFKNPDNQSCTNTIEGNWSGIKKNIPNRMRTRNLVKGKLIEYIWRRKNKYDLWKGFVEALKICHVE